MDLWGELSLLLLVKLVRLLVVERGCCWVRVLLTVVLRLSVMLWQDVVRCEMHGVDVVDDAVFCVCRIYFLEARERHVWWLW